MNPFDDNSYPDFDGSLKAQDEKSLSFPFIILNQIQKLVYICSQDFHPGMPLYSDSGVLRGYLPDTKECFSNSVWHLKLLLTPYIDDSFNKAINSLKKEEMDDRDYYAKVYEECLLLIKRLGVLPADRGRFMEIIGGKKSKKEADKVIYNEDSQ